MSSGTKGMILWLAGVTVALIFAVSLIEAIARVSIDGKELSFPEALWLSMLRTMDPGTMGDGEGAFFRAASLLVTIGRVLVVSSLIGLLANGIADKLAELRRGRSPVMESGHTLILGWSPKIYAIISELTIANENQRHASIVVLAPLDKDEMQHDISARVPDMTTRLVCRTGVPYELIDLDIAQPARAKSVIVLNTGGIDGDERDVDLFPQGDSGEFIVSERLTALIMAQLSENNELAPVFEDLLDEAGSELHLIPAANYLQTGQVTGFADIVAAARSRGEVALGYQVTNETGVEVVINPRKDRLVTLGEADCVIVLGEEFA